ncbi:TPA: hypothetical protein ACH3X3_002269 [Trebouxia sp. C0006]
MADIDLFDNWFRVADKDKDGAVSGAEAVEFFQRSKLPQATLFQVWNMVAGDTPALNKPQFYSTLRLISLAQRSGGTLQEAQARSLLIGVGPQVPPPQMAGLETKVIASINSSWTHNPGGNIQAQQPESSFPAMQPADAVRYQSMFQQMDNNRDGYVQGGDCFGAFMQWGLPKGTLKDVWAAVAGDQGYLSQQQFVQCLYLMDNAKRGIPPPPKVPTGAFPPMAAAAPTPQGGPRPSAPQAPTQDNNQPFDVFSQDMAFPGLPGAAKHQPSKAAAYESKVPELDTGMLTSLPAAQQARLTAERDSVAQLDQQVYKTQVDNEASRAKEAFYQQALQDLTLFKSKTNAALLQAAERSEKLESEATAMEGQYASAYAGARETYSQGRARLDAIQAARTRKLEAESKLAGLQKDLAELGSVSGDQAGAEEAQTMQLHQEIANAEGKKAALEMSARAVREEHEDLQRELETVQLSVEAAKADVTTAQRELRTLRDKLRGEDRTSVTELQNLLKQTAEVYRSLVQHAKAASVPVPPEAQLGTGVKRGPDQLEYDEFAAANATDWDDFQDEGFVVVSALPNDSRYVSPASTRAPSPMGSRAESFTAGTKGTPAKSGLSDQSVHSTGMAPDAGDTASSGIAKTSGAFGSGFGNFGFGSGGSSGDTASRGMKAAKPTEQDSNADSWAAF